MFAALGVDATRLYSSAKTKKFSDFLPKIGVQLQLATCFRPGETDLTLEAFEGWVYQYIRRRRIGKRYFWRCRNVQNFLYFWYNVECWTGNSSSKKQWGSPGQGERKHGQMGDGPSHTRPLMCFAVAAADVYFFHQSCKSNGPAGMKLEYRYAEFKNFVVNRPVNTTILLLKKSWK